MAHWLFKSEPDTWSWDQQAAQGAKGTFWNGVRNHSAKLNLMAMKKGEQGFFYHSNQGKAVVGIVEVMWSANAPVTGDSVPSASGGRSSRPSSSMWRAP